MKAGRKVGFPKFKKKGVRDSFRLAGVIHVLGNHVQLPRLGAIRLKETAAVEGRILSATVRREADCWLSIAVELEMPDPQPVQGDVVGIDVGLTTFAVLSTGEKVDAPKPLTRMLRRVKRLSRSVSRKQRGSKNRKKASLELARPHLRQLGYKTIWYGSKLVLADRWMPSSKTCHKCGHKMDKMPLSIREWMCPRCGMVHDRDRNAATNLELLAG